MKKQDVITVSAPGKIHLMGEHAVVYGKPALLSAIDMRCMVQLTPTENDVITITVKDLKKKIIYSFEEITALTRNAGKRWAAFQKTKDSSLLTSQSFEVLALAIGETITYLQKYLPSGFDLTISSDIPIGSGLGSSAAISVAAVAAVMKFVSNKIDKEAVNAIAFRIEQRIHGNPSGGDNSICCYGGIVLFQNGFLKKNVVIPEANFFLLNSGKPVETTGEMVHAVSILQKKNKELFETFLHDQEQITRDMVSVLANGDEKHLMELIKLGERNLEKIGVVSESAKSLIAMIEEEGGAAKICGAGGRKKGSGMLLVYHHERDQLKEVFLKNKLTFYDIILGTKGVTRN